MKSKLVEFRPEPGIVPEGAAAGEEFDLVTTYRVKDGGTICVVKVGDVQMPGYGASDSKSESRPTYQDYSQSMMSEGG